ncbi:MAG: HAMP domain-containing sensor histidine kinase [Sulfitobacter sp.]|uniref:sensor histidine kinase n=1 Tax=Sulfitobacter sp. TaxID=1903071 RepID=UPI000C643887|nr:HAMP domain-containing sensor histidine kinase [Sulfitobacter sp.]MBD81862.1 two-component sensor histidine kinase [Sulfitobacter sp.]HAC49658.1 two-component sensor histidine kinase [Sulfitobacter sp.]
MIKRRSLRTIGSLLVIAAFIAGGLAVWLWSNSNASWRAHQERAYVAGINLYYAVQNGTVPAEEVQIRALSPEDQAHAANGAFRQISQAPHAPRVTIVLISADSANSQTGAPLTMAILSPDLTYKLAEIPNRANQTAAEKTGEVFRLVASYCSDPVVLAQMGSAPWFEIDGASVLNCDAAPADHRIWAVLLTALSMGAILTVILNLSAEFSQFAEQLRSRRRIGGPASYELPGPQELQEIVAAVNSFLEDERQQLSSRAAVLSGVSHDLGTPATRLRLRTALIPDFELRQKLEADIDSMTGIIESVLTYTRAEMNVEAPRKLSLGSLIDSIVADYQDMGKDVTFREGSDIIVQGARSVFTSRQGQSVFAPDRDVTVMGRPISLERAVANLIENALKYGRRATVALEADAQTATIVIEDEGSESSAADMEALMAPFQRGTNTATIDGYGLGLTIVAAIAKLHGGSLSFKDTPVGLSACLLIDRG